MVKYVTENDAGCGAVADVVNHYFKASLAANEHISVDLVNFQFQLRS